MSRRHARTPWPVALAAIAVLVVACTGTDANTDTADKTADKTTTQPSDSPTAPLVPRGDRHHADPRRHARWIPGAYSVGLLLDDGPTRAVVHVPEGYHGGGPVIGADDGDVAFWGRVTRVDTDPCLGGKKVGAGTTVHDLAARLTALRHMKVSQPEPVTIGGYHGVYLALTAPADLDRCRRGSVTILTGGDAWLQWDVPNATFHEWILDVRGTRVVGGARISPGAVHTAELADMVESARFTRHRPAVAGATIMCANRTVLASLVAVLAASLTACAGSPRPPLEPQAAGATARAGQVKPHADDGSPVAPDSAGAVTLAFAGDMHFEVQLAALLAHPEGALGPMTRVLGGADLTMVNLESSISHRGVPGAKELEEPGNRYHFRTSPAALDVLAGAGVDVVTMANNHGADYGPLGLQDTLRAIRHSPVHVVGVGANRRAAFTPYRLPVRDTTFAFFGADASFREGSSSVWAAGRRTAGLAAAHAARPRALLDAVRTADRRGDVVVVYLHWGEELQGCPTAQQRSTARALARRRRGRRGRQPRACPPRVRVDGRHLRRLRPRQLPLVPQPPTRDRRPPAAGQGRDGGR